MVNCVAISMRRLLIAVGFFVSATSLINSSGLVAKELSELRVAVVGHERNEDYVSLLKAHVKEVESFERDKFNPHDADAFDVVLLDWQQTPSADIDYLKNEPCPLGDRQSWTRPTVLVGSAGMRLSCTWSVSGSVGCTCLDPVAYGLREHQALEKPFPIDRKKMISMPTPEDFAHEIEAKTVEALPIVENPHAIWEAGFCTYANTFDQYPEVEIICGGFNHKTPTAAAIWRQGNLLHFGFKQSPAEMNDFGDHMLLNSVAYISHFSQDRPIAIAPGAFVGNYVRPRSVVGRWWVKPDYKEGVKSVVSEVVWDQIHQQDNAEAMFKWIEEHTPYFYPAEDGRLAVDPDLKALTMGFDDAKFLPTVIADLDHSDTAAQESAKRLLKRYAPDGPVDSSKADWLAWYEENRPYLFATDQGDYRWYIDPLAKARGVPSKDLRSAARMDK